MARTARAQGVPQFWYTYHPIPVGGRTATMGGAATAFGSDSAMPLLNPAGLAQVDQHHISMSATVYGLHAIEATHFSTAGTPPEDQEIVSRVVDTYSSQTFTAFPTGFVYSWPMGAPPGEPGHHVLSLSVVTPRQYTLQPRRQFGVNLLGAHIQFVSSKDSSLTEYDFGPSYAIQLARGVRVGISALLAYSRLSSTFASDRRVVDGADAQTVTEAISMHGQSYAALPVIGVQVNPAGGLHLGASVALESIPLAGSLEATSTDQETNSLGMVLDNLGTSATRTTTQFWRSAEYRIQSPMVVSLGIGYQVPRSFALAADVQYYAPVSYRYFSGTLQASSYSSGSGSQVTTEPLTEDVRGDAVINVSAGGEVFVTDNIAVRAGVFTDRSPTPTLDARNVAAMEARQVDMVGGSLGLGLYFGPVDFTIGAVYEGGIGKIGAGPDLLDPNQTALPSVTESRLMAIVTGGVSFGSAFSFVKIVDQFCGDAETPDECFRRLHPIMPGSGPKAPSIPDPLPAEAPKLAPPPASLPGARGAPSPAAPATGSVPAPAAPAPAVPPPVDAPKAPGSR